MLRGPADADNRRNSVLVRIRAALHLFQSGSKIMQSEDRMLRVGAANRIIVSRMQHRRSTTKIYVQDIASSKVKLSDRTYKSGFTMHPPSGQRKIKERAKQATDPLWLFTPCTHESV